jgi:hypothetical protein
MENITKHLNSSIPELRARFMSFHKPQIGIQNKVWTPSKPNPYSLNVSRPDGFPLKRRRNF